MYQDYLNDIIKHYRAGEKNGEIPQRLIQPTPGSIKEECVSVCEARFQKEDVRTLAAFFKVDNDKHGMLRAIHRCDRDRFKPLVNFIKGITNNTDDLNIELLAWLIDFPNRPFRAEKYLKASGRIQNEVLLEKTERKSGNEDVTAYNDDEAFPKTDVRNLHKIQKNKSLLIKLVSFASTRKKTALVIIGVLLLTLLGFYIVDWKAPAGIVENKQVKTGDVNADRYGLVASVSSPGGNPEVVYIRCTGLSPCRACSNCSSCNWCNSGGTCQTCVATKKTSTQKRKSQCQATTRKGTLCSRTAKEGSKYCWQHVR
jgi:hypothetical protein